MAKRFEYEIARTLEEARQLGAQSYHLIPVALGGGWVMERESEIYVPPPPPGTPVEPGR